MDPGGEPHGEEQTMKKPEDTTSEAKDGLTRREFVGGAFATAGIITGAPAFLRGQNLNSKMNIAFIASGGRAGASMGELTLPQGRGAAAPPDAGAGGRGAGGRPGGAAGPAAPHPDENVTVICDVNQNAVDSAAQRYPQAKKYNDYRRVFDSPNDFDSVVVA